MILEYRLHMTPGGMKTPDFVQDGGYFFRSSDNTYIGWTEDSPEFHVPNGVNRLTASELDTRVLAIHAITPYTSSDDAVDGDDMTDAEVSAMVTAWVNAR